MVENNSSGQSIIARIKHLFGVHCWVTEYFGNGYPMRECQICGLVEFKPLGSKYFFTAGEGTTLETTRELHRKMNAIYEKYDSSSTTNNPMEQAIERMKNRT